MNVVSKQLVKQMTQAMKDKHPSNQPLEVLVANLETAMIRQRCIIVININSRKAASSKLYN